MTSHASCSTRPGLPVLPLPLPAPPSNRKFRSRPCPSRPHDRYRSHSRTRMVKGVEQRIIATHKGSMHTQRIDGCQSIVPPPFSCRESPRTPIAFRRTFHRLSTLSLAGELEGPSPASSHWTAVDPRSPHLSRAPARVAALQLQPRPPSRSRLAHPKPRSMSTLVPIHSVAQASSSHPSSLHHKAPARTSGHLFRLPVTAACCPCTQRKAPVRQTARSVHGGPHMRQRHSTGVIGSERWGFGGCRRCVCRVAVGRKAVRCRRERDPGAAGRAGT